MPHPDFLEQVLSVRQLGDWQRFYGEEPWGAEVDDTRNALIALVTMRAAGSKTAKLEHFKLLKPKAEPADEEDEYGLAKQVRAVFGLPQVR